jgi:hypothetical protein
MPRKPNGRPRGRPQGSLLYPVPDNLLLEVARLSGGDRLKEPAAARAVAQFVGGPVVDKASKVRRILRQYRPRRDWFLMRIKAPSTERSRPRGRGLSSVLGISEATQAFLESQRQFDRLVESFAQSPAIGEMERLEKQQRMIENMLKGPFGS